MGIVIVEGGGGKERFQDGGWRISTHALARAPGSRDSSCQGRSTSPVIPNGEAITVSVAVLEPRRHPDHPRTVEHVEGRDILARCF